MFIDDQAGVISPQAKAAIEGSSAHFDVKVFVGATDSRGALDARLGQMVNSANTLAIGVDPVHHYTFTHFGVGTGIPRDQFQAVAKAGNGEFHAGRWGEGIQSIIASATAVRREAREAAPSTVVVQTRETVDHGVPAWPFVLGGLSLALAGVLLARHLRRRQRAMESTLDDFRDEAAQLRSRNIEEQAWHDKMAPKAEALPSVGRCAPQDRPSGVRVIPSPLPGPMPVFVAPAPAYNQGFQPAPVVVSQSSNDGLLTGVLLGEALADRRPSYVPPPDPPRYRAPDPEPSYSSSSSSWDSGGGSFDSGSSGGGFDSGGGGFDGGSGGGDF